MNQLTIVGEGAGACQVGSQSDLIASLNVEPIEPANRRGTFSLVSLGCPKNLVDSERMLGLLRDDGWQFVADNVSHNTHSYQSARSRACPLRERGEDNNYIYYIHLRMRGKQFGRTKIQL